jgi:hypothetical protein
MSFCVSAQHSWLTVFRSNGRHTVGDGAFTFDNEPSVLAVAHLQGMDDMYYYSSALSGGPGVSLSTPPVLHLTFSLVALLTPPRQNALQTEGRRTG